MWRHGTPISTFIYYSLVMQCFHCYGLNKNLILRKTLWNIWIPCALKAVARECVQHANPSFGRFLFRPTAWSCERVQFETHLGSTQLRRKIQDFEQISPTLRSFSGVGAPHDGVTSPPPVEILIWALKTLWEGCTGEKDCKWEGKVFAFFLTSLPVPSLSSPVFCFKRETVCCMSRDSTIKSS